MTSPNKDEILAKITEVLVQLFEVEADEVTLEANLYEDLDIDSIDAVDLVVELKKWTGKKIQADDFKSVRTVADVVNAVAELMQE